jgi:muramidase (phage lysozyme)
MAAARSSHFDPHVNADLLKLIESFQYGPYKVRANSGYRPGDPRLHGRGQAIDVSLVDPKSGAALPNTKDPRYFKQYQEYANALYKYAQQTNPELAKKLRWGGYFSGGKNQYGALDLMHFDTAGDTTPTAGGSWEGGLNEQQAKLWNIAAGGGIGADAAVQQMKPDVRAAFLSTIASGESPGYDVMYGGKKFTDFSHHPKTPQTVGDITSDVAGRYQFKGSTWDEQAAKYGYKDFSPETQDTAAWNYANDIYKQKTGGSLEEALASGDPARINAAAQVLNQTWTSLPGGAEQSKGYGGKTFYDVYSGNLKNAPAPFHKPGDTTNPMPSLTTEDKGTDWDAKLAASLGSVGSGANFGARPSTAPLPSTGYTQGVQTPMFDVQAPQQQRQQLAEAMMKLNSGKLWG